MSGFERRSQITAMFTMRNANSVPMLTSSAISASGTNAAISAIGIANTSVSSAGVFVRSQTRASRSGMQPVAAHREGHARLPVEDRQHHARDRDERAERDDVRAPADAGALGQRDRERRILAGELVGGQRADRRDGDEDVDDRRDHERADDRDRQVALGLARLLAGRWRPRRSRCRRRR